MDFSMITAAIVTGLQLLIGKGIKSNPKLANGLIWWVNTAVGVIINAIAPFVVPEAHAATSAGTVVSGILGNPLLMGIIQSTLTTGIHSTAKNFWQMLKALAANQKLPGQS